VDRKKLSPPDENGLMIEPDIPEEFAKGLSRYLESSELTAKMVAAGKNMLKQYPAWNNAG
jgi:hypothetical protein